MKGILQNHVYAAAGMLSTDLAIPAAGMLSTTFSVYMKNVNKAVCLGGILLQNHVYVAAGILIHTPCNPSCRDAIHDVFGLHEKRS